MHIYIYIYIYQCNTYSPRYVFGSNTCPHNKLLNMGVCTVSYPLIAVVAVSVMSCAWCLIFWILDMTTGQWYINILYVHCFAGTRLPERYVHMLIIHCSVAHAQGYINVHRSIGTRLPEKLFTETYQWKILSLKNVYLLIGWYLLGVTFVIYWLLKTLLDILHVHSRDVYSCADCGLQYWIWAYGGQWTSWTMDVTCRSLYCIKWTTRLEKSGHMSGTLADL